MLPVGGLYAIRTPFQIAASREHPHKPRTKNPNLTQKDNPPRRKRSQQLKVGATPLDGKLLELFQTVHLERTQHAHMSLTSCHVEKKTQLVLLTQASSEEKKVKRKEAVLTMNLQLGCQHKTKHGVYC